MADEALYEFHDRKSLFNICVIFVAAVMDGNKVAVISVDPGGGNNRPPQIAPNVFYGSFWVAFIWPGIDIETVFMFLVTTGFHLFERRTGSGLHLIKQGGTESVAEISVVEMIDIAPEPVIAVPAFRNETMDMGIPFQVPSKGMENHDKTGSEIHGFVLLVKHLGNNSVHRMKETVKQCPAIKEKLPQVFVNGKDTMTVGGIDQLKGHGRSALHGVEIPTGRAEAAMAAERDKF